MIEECVQRSGRVVEMRALTGLGVYPICRALAPGKGTANIAMMGVGLGWGGSWRPGVG